MQPGPVPVDVQIDSSLIPLLNLVSAYVAGPVPVDGLDRHFIKCRIRNSGGPLDLVAYSPPFS